MKGCKEILDTFNEDASLKTRIQIYKKIMTLVLVGPDWRAQQYKRNFLLPIKRFIKALHYREKKKILSHLKQPVKKQHWMWWAFPQEVGAWGSAHVSDTTKEYAITLDEAILFLVYEPLQIYYIEALEILSQKKNNLEDYFGAIDYTKLKSNIDIFGRAAKFLKNARITRLIKKINATF
jgi:uncharacterized protein (DUF1810 family)